MRAGAGVVWAVLLVTATPVLAEESFYPIVDPNGNVMILRGERKPAPAATEAAPAAPAPPAEAAPAPPVPVAPASGRAAERGTAPAPATPALAPYDSDDYTDSEALEAAAKAAVHDKKRFYVIDDRGLGVMNVEEDGRNASTGLAAPDAEADAALLARPLPVRRAELAPAAAQARWPGLESCQAAARLPAARPVANLPVTLVVDATTRAFPEAPRVLYTLRVAGEGLRTLRLRTFARSDRKPDYAVPPVALLDEAGCLRRVVVDWPERAYPATRTLHPMIEGMVELHAEERYALVLADAGETPRDTLYRYSRHGQLNVSLYK